MAVADRKYRFGRVDSNLSDIPLFAKMKLCKLPSGEKVLDINYFYLMAYSGPSRVYFGAHNGDCEHVTVRCTTGGRLISGMFWPGFF